MGQKNEKLRRQLEALRADVAQLGETQRATERLYAALLDTVSRNNADRIAAERRAARRAQREAHQQRLNAVLALILAAVVCCAALIVTARADAVDPSVVTILDIDRLPGDDIPFATEYAYYDGPLVYYPITDDDRSTLEHIVQGEAGGESYEGKCWVATCLLNAMRLEGMTAAEVRTAYQYAGWSDTVSDETIKAVSAVFDDGETTHDTVLWFYAPKLCNGTWHETQSYVATVGGHKFFAP